MRSSLQNLFLLIAAAAVIVSPAVAQTAPDLASGQFTPGCGNATVAPIFNAALMNSGLYGESNLLVVSDPDIVLVNNQWWMIFATGPTGLRALQPFAAYLPPGASLSTTTTYPSDPNGWRLVGAQANGQGFATPVYGYPGANGWDQLAAETPSVNVGPDGSVSIYYAGHNAGQTPFQIGLMTNFVNGQGNGLPNPVMGATLPWEYSAGLPALLEQSVRWIPSLNKYIMYYTAGAWWANPAPDNVIAYAESTDGIHWVNRQPLDFPVAYYNQDFLYNEQFHRFEMVISKDRTGAGGANPRDIVWREAATPATAQANWLNETTLLFYGDGFYNSGVLSPSMKYGNLPGEENRLYVFFHSYDTAGNMQIGRFYCDAAPSPTPTFSLSQSNPAVAVVQNSGTTMNFGVNAQAGFTGAVNFSVSGVPSGVTAALTQPSSTTGTGLNIFVPSTAVPGTYPIVVTGTSGAITQTSTFTLTVTPPPSFNLTASVSNLSLAPGAGNTLSINVTPLNGFNGTVNFSATGFPANVNNSFLQPSSTTGTTYVIYVQPTVAPGSYPITVTGTSGSLTATANFTLTVTGPPTFSLTPSATAVSAMQGAGSTVNVAVNDQNGFTGAVSFSASGFPTGGTGTFQPVSSATGTTLAIAASATAVPGQYPIVVTGSSGSLSIITSFTLTVVGAPVFSLTPSATAVSATQGTGTTVNIGVTPQYGFNSAVGFSASGFPTGVTGTFQPASSATGTTLSVAASATAVPGQYPITVTGVSGTLTQTASFTLTVVGAPVFSLTSSVTAISATQGTGTTVNIGVSPLYGFASAVNFSAAGFPTGVSSTFLPASSTSGSTLVFFVQPTVAPGQYPITVTGASGGLTATASFTLTVVGAPVFSLTPSVKSVSATQGSGATVNIGVAPQYGFNSAVGFSASGFPTGVTGTFQPVSSATGTTLSIAASATAVPGQYPIAVTGTAGSLTMTTSFTLTVVGAPNFSLAPSVATVSLQPGAGTSLTIGVKPVYGFAGTVSFAASGFPATVNNSFLQTTSPTGSTLVVYVQPATPAGNYPITVTGTSGTLSQNTTFTLTVTGAPQPQTITFNPINPQKAGTILTVSATASSGLPVTFMLVPNGNCSISGNVVTFLNPGACGVIATQPGNAAYQAAPAVGQVITVTN